MSSQPAPGSWNYLPAEIRNSILTLVLQISESLASFATVSREWQSMAEHRTFAQITLTLDDLKDFDQYTRRNRALVRLIYLSSSFTPCEFCNESRPDQFESLFSTLIRWEPMGTLVLAIGMDMNPRILFNYGYGGACSEYMYGNEGAAISFSRYMERQSAASLRSAKQGWAGGIRGFLSAANRIIPEPLVHESAGDSVLEEEEDGLWWDHKSAGDDALDEEDSDSSEDDQSWEKAATSSRAYCSLSGNLDSGQPRKLVLLGDFFRAEIPPPWPPRFPTSELAEGLAHVSQRLEQLSVSYVIDVSPFLQACETAPSEWPDLTSLTLTSCLLTSETSGADIDSMLERAAEVARRMPKLEVMEIWNARPELAAAFIYRLADPAGPAEIAWRGTWEYGPSPSVVRAWEAVALGRGGCEITPSVVVREILNGDFIGSDGDAIPQLKLLTQVARPTSIGGVDCSEKWDDCEAGHCREAVVYE
ncbi:hypothetical protein CSOJ01_06834 [Colletotrichum sojae]|uniref:DUF6546 domain-containing protein n=1 Tax=Colletotrichum sojae TaxID=2175907 RepID=A0A8H6JB93_9PEZI|nr:hypothetical protein CSOJ01_06834 [Colletotrichum sojae]